MNPFLQIFTNWTDFNYINTHAQNQGYKLTDTADPDFDAIILFNMNYTNDLFTKGYQVECDRMKDINIRCSHHKYNSIHEFYKYLQKARKQRLTGYSNNDPFTNLIGNGFCRKCGVYIMSKLIDITKYKTLFKHRVHSCETDDSEQKLYFFVNCMQYVSTANFVFNQSNLWIIMMLYLGNIIMDMKQRIGFKMRNDGNYQNIAILLFQLIRNIHILN
eukprot:429421_1